MSILSTENKYRVLNGCAISSLVIVKLKNIGKINNRNIRYHSYCDIRDHDGTEAQGKVSPVHRVTDGHVTAPILHVDS